MIIQNFLFKFDDEIELNEIIADFIKFKEIRTYTKVNVEILNKQEAKLVYFEKDKIYNIKFLKNSDNEVQMIIESGNYLFSDVELQNFIIKINAYQCIDLKDVSYKEIKDEIIKLIEKNHSDVWFYPLCSGWKETGLEINGKNFSIQIFKKD